MSTSKKHEPIKASDFDKAFDEGDVAAHLDVKSAKVRYPVQRVSIDFPKRIIEGIDHEAAKIGVTRTALIKIWIAQQLTQVSR